MFSFVNGKPIARVFGGNDHGKILRIKNDDEEESSKCCNCNNCNDDCYYDPCCKKCYKHKKYYNEKYNKDFEIYHTDGKLSHFPNTKTRDVLYIAGPSGSGKSTVASEYIKNYLDKYPKSRFLLFSRKPNDEVLDKLKPIRILINEKLLTKQIDVAAQLPSHTIILFDDCTTIQNKELKKLVEKIMDDIMEIGRAYNLYIIITNHLVIPNEQKHARTILNEAHSITIFPKSGSSQQISYALNKYFGLNKKQIDQILNIPSRWVTVYKHYPMCVMHTHGAYSL